MYRPEIHLLFLCNRVNIMDDKDYRGLLRQMPTEMFQVI